MKNVLLTLIVNLCLSLANPHTVNQPFLLDIGFECTVTSKPIITNQQIVIPIQKNGSHAILNYNLHTKKQRLLNLKPKEVILNNQFYYADQQILLLTAKDQKKYINLYDFNTHRLTQIQPPYKNFQVEFNTPNQTLFQAKDKDKCLFFILDTKNKKIIKSNKRYLAIPHVVRLNKDQMIAIVSSKPGQQQIAFIDLNKKCIHEDTNSYNSICSVDPCSFNKAIAILELLPNVKGKQCPEKIGFIDFEKKKIIESSNKYFKINYEISKNKSRIAIANKYENLRQTFLLIDPEINQIIEPTKHYDTILDFQKISTETTVGFVCNQNNYYCLHINNYTKEIKEIPIKEKVFLPKHYQNRVIDNQKVLAYKINAGNKYSLGLINIFTGIFEEKIKNLEITNLNTKTDDLGRGIIYYSKPNTYEEIDKIFLLNTQNSTIQKIDKKYKNIITESFFHADKLFGLATLKSHVQPIFVNFRMNAIEELNESYRKIILNLRTTINNNLIAGVLKYPNQQVILRFDTNNEQVIEYPVQEKFSPSFQLKNIFSLQPQKPKNLSGDYLYGFKDKLYVKKDSNDQIILVNEKNECIIRESIHTDQLHFIPYKQKLIVCPDKLENVNLLVN